MQTDNDRLYRSEKAIQIGCSYAIVAAAILFGLIYLVINLIF